MGVFTEQVQNVADNQKFLVTEAKHKRLEREAAKKQKERLEQLEIDLYNILDSYFSDEMIERKDYKKQYIILSHAQNKHNIIDELTKEDKEVYYLEKKYISILNNVYNGYKLYWNDKYKNSIEKAEVKLYKTLKNTLERKELHTRSGSHYFKTIEETYNFLIMPTSKDSIISIFSNDTETTYKLDKKYLNILNALYRPYKLTNKQTNTTKQHKTSQTQQKANTAKIKKNHNIFILIVSTIFAILFEAVKILCYIFLVPLVFIVSFFIHKK